MSRNVIHKINWLWFLAVCFIKENPLCPKWIPTNISFIFRSGHGVNPNVRNSNFNQYKTEPIFFQWCRWKSLSLNCKVFWFSVSFLFPMNYSKSLFVFQVVWCIIKKCLWAICSACFFFGLASLIWYVGCVLAF